MTTLQIDPVVRTLVVDAPPDVCFRTFVDGFDSWWPREHHIGQDRTITDVRIEPREGGRCYDVDTTGTECHWGTVLTYEPPTRLVFAWHIQPDFTTVDRDPARQSEVEVTFSALDDGRTEVRLVHGHLERHGDGGEQLRGSVGNDDGGWGFLLQRFADRVEGREPRALRTP